MHRKNGESSVMIGTSVALSLEDVIQRVVADM